MVSPYGLTLALVASASWGAVYVIYEFILDGVNPLKVMFLGSIFSALVLGTMFLVKAESVFFFERGDTKTIFLLLGAFAIGLLANWAILSSIKELGSATASIIEVCYPIFTVLILFLLFGREFGPRFLIGAGFVLVGVTLVISSPARGVVETTEPPAQAELAS